MPEPSAHMHLSEHDRIVRLEAEVARIGARLPGLHHPPAWPAWPRSRAGTTTSPVRRFPDFVAAADVPPSMNSDAFLFTPLVPLLRDEDFEDKVPMRGGPGGHEHPGEPPGPGGPDDPAPAAPSQTPVVLVGEQAQVPTYYHSQTRHDCHYQVVERQVEGAYEARLDGLQEEVSSFLVRGEQQVEARLTSLLQLETNFELAEQISTATGIPLVPEITASGSNVLTARSAAELAAIFVRTIQSDLIIYDVHVSGNIWGREIARVREVWQWVGEDCERLGVPGTGDVLSYQLAGAWGAIPVDWHFTKAELTSPTIPPGGDDWAVAQTKGQLHQRVRAMQAQFARLPAPAAVPDPVARHDCGDSFNVRGHATGATESQAEGRAKDNAHRGARHQCRECTPKLLDWTVITNRPLPSGEWLCTGDAMYECR